MCMMERASELGKNEFRFHGNLVGGPDKTKRTQHGNILMAINPNSFFHLFGLVSLQGEREWRE